MNLITSSLTYVREMFSNVFTRHEQKLWDAMNEFTIFVLMQMQTFLQNQY
jgi:hypothetical protein